MFKLALVTALLCPLISAAAVPVMPKRPDGRPIPVPPPVSNYWPKHPDGRPIPVPPPVAALELDEKSFFDEYDPMAPDAEAKLRAMTEIYEAATGEKVDLDSAMTQIMQIGGCYQTS